MTERAAKAPGPDHPITIVHNQNRVLVKLGDTVIADTVQALVLKEANYPAVFYVPRKDAQMNLLERSELRTYCPYKGEASYFSIPLGGEKSANAVWSYEEPYHAVSEIKGHLAFYPDRVGSIFEGS